MTTLPGGAAAARRIDPSVRRLVALALPMMLAHLTEPLLGLVDATVIGRLGEVHLLGAVAMGAIVFDLLFWGLGSLRMSTAAFTAQAHGAGQDDEVSLAVARALLLATAIGGALILLQGPLTGAVLGAMGPSTAVEEAARTYIAVRIWSAPFALANYSILGSLIGRARTDLGLALQVGINVSKIALTIAFVPGLHWGIAGAAWATVLAELLGTVAGLAVLVRLGTGFRAIRLAALVEGPALKRLLVVNRDVAIRSFALVTAFAFFTAQGARAGDLTLAANAVLYNLFLFGSYFLDGFAAAAEQLTGQSIGARDESGFRRSVRNAVWLSIATGLGVTLLVLAGGGHFIAFVTTHPEVRATALAFLPYAALTPLVGAAAFAFDGIYVGATWTRAMRDLMLISLALYLATWWLASGWSAAGLWIAFLVFLGSRGIGQALAYPALARRSFGTQVPG
ncbi:MATE family efflux transporter [Alsobacter sp. R-9]